MRPTPYVASLRVFEPQSAFDATDQLNLSNLSNLSKRYIGSSLSSSKIAEEFGSKLRMATLTIPSSSSDGAHLLEMDGAKYFSPWSTTVRTWASLSDLKSSYSPTVLPLFISNSFQEAIEESIDLSSIRVPHSISQTWMIPPRWFALFEIDERIRGNDGGRPFVILRTKIQRAIERAKRTHEAVRNAFGEGPVEHEIVNLIEWLEIFNSESIVELDYGGLAYFLNLALADEGGIEADSSIEDIKSSVEGLLTGDGVMAGKGYERLITRWRKVAAFEGAS